MGWTVYVEVNHSGRPNPKDPTAVTGSTGDYMILDVRPGRYRVAPVFPPGWAPTALTAGWKRLTVRAGETEQPIDFSATQALYGVSLSLISGRSSSFRAGAAGHLTLHIANQANGPRLNGKFDIALSASADSLTPNSTAFFRTTRTIHLRTGGARNVFLNFRIPPTLAPGPYGLFASLVSQGAPAPDAVVTPTATPIAVTQS